MSKAVIRVSFMLTLLSALVACDNQRVYESYRGMESLHWEITDTVRFEIDPIKHQGSYVLGVKYTDAYDFRNLYVRYLLKDSLNHVIENTLVNIPLFERSSGKPLGKGFGSSFTKYDTLPVKNGVGVAQVEFIQYMRVETLPGIEAIGLKIVKN